MGLNTNFTLLTVFCVILIAFTFPNNGYSQGDGPLTYPLTPANITVINPTYINLTNNLTPGKDIVLAQGKIDMDVFALPIFHTFKLGGTYAQIFLTPQYGHMTGTVKVGGNFGYEGISIPETEIELVDKSGWLDSGLLFRVGLYNTPPLDVIEFMKWKPKFQLSGLLGITAPIGKYSESNRINLGSNRWVIRLGAPMVIPLNLNKKRHAQTEFTPSVLFFTNNNKPFIGDTKRQKPLLLLEQHTTKYFTDKLWLGIDARYQLGGVTQIDDLPKGEQIDQLSAGVSVGYDFLSILSIQASYGRIWFNGDNGNMFRIVGSLVIPSKKDIKKLKELQQKQQANQ
ncbi:transporter [Limibacter armeniacum]|uniref:transporter n=1 Tax=Limibacter armeniacum TaxID=466084 RepID=UPI002FE6BFF1